MGDSTEVAIFHVTGQYLNQGLPYFRFFSYHLEPTFLYKYIILKIPAKKIKSTEFDFEAPKFPSPWMYHHMKGPNNDVFLQFGQVIFQRKSSVSHPHFDLGRKIIFHRRGPRPASHL